MHEYLLRTKFGFGENILLMVDNHTDPLRRPTRSARLWQQQMQRKLGSVLQVLFTGPHLFLGVTYAAWGNDRSWQWWRM